MNSGARRKPRQGPLLITISGWPGLGAERGAKSALTLISMGGASRLEPGTHWLKEAFFSLRVSYRFMTRKFCQI